MRPYDYWQWEIATTSFEFWLEITCNISAMWNTDGNKLPACSHFQMALKIEENA